MSPTPSPFLATSLKALTRATLLSLGMDHILIYFLTHAAVGAATGLLAILFFGIRIPATHRRVPKQGSAKSNPVRLRASPIRFLPI
jgi:hypothetical protein